MQVLNNITSLTESIEVAFPHGIRIKNLDQEHQLNFAKKQSHQMTWQSIPTRQ